MVQLSEIWQCSIDWLGYMNVNRCVSYSYTNIWSIFLHNDGVAWGYWCLFAFQIILFANYKICKFYCWNADIPKMKYLFIANLKWRNVVHTKAHHFVRHRHRKRLVKFTYPSQVVIWKRLQERQTDFIHKHLLSCCLYLILL